MRTLRNVLAEAPLAWLLFAVPAAAWVHHARPDNPLLVFVLACVAEGIGGFLNATLGNAAELIIALVALCAGMLDMVKASLTGSIIGNLLLVLGAAFLAGRRGVDRRMPRRQRRTPSTCRPISAGVGGT